MQSFTARKMEMEKVFIVCTQHIKMKNFQNNQDKLYTFTSYK